MPSTILARVDLRLELELPAAYSVLVQYADKPPTVEWNGVGHFRQQAAGYAARRGEFVDIRAALQLGSGLMANSLRGTRTRIQVWIPSVSVLHVHSCGTPAWKQVDGKLFARYLYPNTSVDSKCLCLCTLSVQSGCFQDDSIGLLLIPAIPRVYVSKLSSKAQS